MENRKKPILDMTKEGDFIDPPQTEYFRGAFNGRQAPLTERIGRTAILVAMLGFVLCVAALALWFALALIPVVLISSAVAWVAYRIQIWRLGKG
jgi:fatty acid desaturase